MPLPADMVPPTSDMLMRRINELEAKVRELSAGRRAEATTVGSGGFTVDGGMLRLLFNGTQIVYIGPDSNGEPSFRLRWPDGSFMFITYLVEGEDWYWSWYDTSGNQVFVTDANSGQGLARPYIPLPWSPHPDRMPVTGGWPQTTSTSYTALWECRSVKQHPKDNLVFHAKTGGTATGEWRVTQNGVAIPGVTGTFPNGGQAGISTIFAITGGHMEALSLDLEVRVAGGSGTVYAWVRDSHGQQS